MIRWAGAEFRGHGRHGEPHGWQVAHLFAGRDRVVSVPKRNPSWHGRGRLGVKRLAVLSDGSVADGPKPLRNTLRRLRRLQPRLPKKRKGSANREKAKMRVARCHCQVACIRGDALRNLTTGLVRTYGRIVIEDLNVKGMLQSQKLSRVISDMGFGEFRRQPAYKVEVPGSAPMVADRWFPSSKLCRMCDTVRAGLGLGDRVFRCDGCGHVEDRDLHASRNLERYPGLRGNLHAS